MSTKVSEIPCQEAPPFSLTMEVEEDIEQEIESFVRFKRCREYEKAEEIFQQTLSAHLSLFPVIAEYADLLLVQEKYRILSEFLDIQIQYMEPVLEEEEVELLRIMRSLVHIHTHGSLRRALVQADRTWQFLYRRSTELPSGTFASDVEIHIFEVYIRILVFAVMNSNWVQLYDVRCPWAPDEESDTCGFVQWYSMLCCHGYVWGASQVLMLLLQALPLFKKKDVMVLFGKHCFGDIPSERSLVEMSELDQLVACSTSFSRAQALLDLSLTIQQYDPYGRRWMEIYVVAIYYHRAANFLPTIMSCYELKAHIQKTQFELVREAFLDNHSHPTSSGCGYDDCIKAFGQQDLRSYNIAFFHGLSKHPHNTSSFSDGLRDLESLYTLQLEDQENIIGFIQTFFLSLTLMSNLIAAKRVRPRTAFLSPAVDSLLPIRRYSSSTLSPLNRFRQPSRPRLNHVQIGQLKKTLRFQLQCKIPNIILQRSLQLEFETSTELSHNRGGSSWGLDIPTYLWAMHDMLDDLNGTPFQTPPDGLETPYFSNSYVEMIEKFLPEPVPADQPSRIARYILDATGKEVDAKIYADEMQQAETRQDSDTTADSDSIDTMLENNIQIAQEAESGHRRTLEERAIVSFKKPQKGTISKLRPLSQSLPTERYTIKHQEKRKSADYSFANDKSSDSYLNICKELRAELMKRVNLPEDCDHRFVIQGTSEEVLQGDKLVRLFQSLDIPDMGFIFPNSPCEEFLAERLNEEHLHKFLAILVFSQYEIEAVQKFCIKVLVTESWPAGRCSLPTSQEILKQLFEGDISTYPFLANQAIFCPAVIVKGAGIVLSNLEERRLPYLQEEPLGQGSFASVFKVKIARGHLYDPVSDSANQRPVEVARKDYITSDDLIYQRLPEYRDIMTAIFSCARRCEAIIESFGALFIGSSTYSLFMPLANCDLQQYMIDNPSMGPATRATRLGFIENIQRLANGLQFLHTGLKAKGVGSLVCYDLDLKPESVLIFWEKTADGERLTWKISDFRMSRVRYRRRGEERDTVINIKKQFAPPRASETQKPQPSKATTRRREGTCLAPESIATHPVIGTSSDVWSLGCVISIVFAYLEEGAVGVRKYARKRRAHKRTDGCDRFFIHDRGKDHTPLAHPVIEKWHSRLIESATRRSIGEGEAVKSTLRFLESAVFQEQTKRCDARSVEQKLTEIWAAYEEEEVEIVQARQFSFGRFLQRPLIRRIMSRREAQEGQQDNSN